jgi:trigger factor
MSDPAAAPAEASDVSAAVEDAGPCRKRLRIAVPAERVREELDRAFLEVVRTVRVPGFRAGHLPRKVAEQRFGDAVRDEVKGSLMEKAYGEALDRHHLVPLSAPELKAEGVTVDPAKALEFEITVEVRPDIALPDLRGIAVRRPPVVVEDTDVTRAIDDLRLEKAELRPAPDETVGEGDLVVADAEVFVGGERVLGAENVQYRHPSGVLAGIAVPGVAKEIVGKKAGETLSLKVTLPGNFKMPEYAGKESELRVALRDVKRFHMPDLDEAFARAMDFDSVDELRAEARKAVAREKEAEAGHRLDAAILDAILEKAPIVLPEGLVQREIGQVLSRYQADMHLQGASQEAIDEKLAEVQGETKEHVAREFRVAFLTDEFAKKRGIFVTEGEIDEQVGLMAGRYGRSVDEMRKYLEQRDLLPSMRGRLRERKVLEAMRKEVRIE